MKILNVTRGSYREVIIGDGPFVKIDDAIPPSKTKAGWLQTGFRMRFQEKNAIIQCFNEINHVYAFGHDPDNSLFSVSFLVFLGKRCMEDGFSAGSTLKNFFKAYNTNRVSQKKNTAKITFKGTGYAKGILLGFDVDTYDEELNAVTVTFSGKVVGIK